MRGTDYVGLVAYLTVMLGELPDRELLRAASRAEGGADETRLSLGPTAPAPAREAKDDTDGGRRTEPERLA